MKAYLSILAFICCMAQAAAQDTVVVRHDAYTTVFAKSAGIPVVVSYTLRRPMLECAQDDRISRTNNFKADPLVPGTSLGRDYAKSGYDCGHNMSADDNACNGTDMDECFYYTNMYPQAPGLNRGVWKALENAERDLAKDNDSVLVFVGSFGCDKKIGMDSVVVPEYCWKVIYIPKLKEWDAYIFPNRKCDGTPARYMDTLQEKNWVNWTAEQKAWMRYVIGQWGVKHFKG